MLGLRVEALAGDANAAPVEGWDEAQRAELHAIIAAREPLPLISSSGAVLPMAASRPTQVSGEPMFDQSFRFIGYRGVGVALAK